LKIVSLCPPLPLLYFHDTLLIPLRTLQFSPQLMCLGLPRSLPVATSSRRSRLSRRRLRPRFCPRPRLRSVPIRYVITTSNIYCNILLTASDVSSPLPATLTLTPSTSTLLKLTDKKFVTDCPPISLAIHPRKQPLPDHSVSCTFWVEGRAAQVQGSDSKDDDGEHSHPTKRPRPSHVLWRRECRGSYQASRRPSDPKGKFQASVLFHQRTSDRPCETRA
jgi:hypothetical protein